jgi:hypothetical protein
VTAPLTDNQLRHLRSIIERERTSAGETAAGLVLAATLARLQHLERRLAQAEELGEALDDLYPMLPRSLSTGTWGDPRWTEAIRKAESALAAWAPIEGQEP